MISVAMIRLLFELFLDVDEPPRRLGFLGIAILAIFSLFAAFVWFHHPVPH
jgi:hypothetical protein